MTERRKSQDYYQNIKPDRDAWRQGFSRCMVCGMHERDLHRRGQDLQIHEMLRRSHARNNWAHRFNYLLTCPACHENVLATEPHVRQLARKLRHDPHSFNLEAWLWLRNPNAPEYVTKDELEGEYWALFGRGSGL